MYPTESRIKELRERFGVLNGRFFAHYKYKNLNWYLADSSTSSENDEWFCFGDIRDEDIPHLQALLGEGERLVLGWKDLGPNQKFEKFFGIGGGIWLIISKTRVMDGV